MPSSTFMIPKPKRRATLENSMMLKLPDLHDLLDFVAHLFEMLHQRMNFIDKQIVIFKNIVGNTLNLPASASFNMDSKQSIDSK